MADLQVLDLNEVEDIDDDIRTYISAQMLIIKDQYPDLPSDWPGIDAVDSLVQLAHGLFIWAAVACSYIQAYQPARRIQTLLSSPSVLGLAEDSLNNLYAMAIRDAGPWHTDDFAKDMHDLLAVIIISQNPQTLRGLQDMMGIDDVRASDLVSRLQSILKKDEDGLIRALHPSVRNYLVGSPRCDPGSAWFLDEEAEHIVMAMRCIKHLNKTLKRNMMSVSDPAADPQSLLPLPDAMAYACVSWVYHVCRVELTAEFATTIHGFLSQHFLHWVEALSILGQSRNAIRWLDQLQAKFCECTGFDSSLNILLYDGWRFVKAFCNTIETNPSLVYETVLNFCPKNTSISGMFDGSAAYTVVSGCLQDWSPSVMILSGSTPVQSLMISKSGDAVVASYLNSSSKVWNTSTGTETLLIPEGRSTISTLISSDGKRLIEAMYLGSICLWDVNAQTNVATFHVRDVGITHKTALFCVALAADDCTIVCGFEDGMVQIWNVQSQLPLTPLLPGHDDTVNSVAFSHDQKMIVSGSEDHTLRIWSPTGVHQRTLQGHTDAVHAVTFSPDDSKIASASSDETMKIWDALSGVLLLICRHSPGEWVLAVKFTHSGHRVATGSSHCNIRIWDCESGQEVISPLSLHRHHVRSLVFSPDDNTIFSGSDDSHVRIWSLANKRPHRSSQPRHTNYVTCVALAHDRTHFASASTDGSLIVWDMDGKASMSSSVGHSASISSIDFCPNGKILASGSEDGTVRLWDVVSGRFHDPPLKHSEKVVSVKFSTSGLKLATVTTNQLTLWSTLDENLFLGPFLHPGGRCQAVAFSHDGAHVATFYDYTASETEDNYNPSEAQLGLGITIRDANNGCILLEKNIDTVIDGTELHSVVIEYAANGRYLVVWYGLSITAPDDIMTRAFDAVTGEELLYEPGTSALPEFNKPVGINTQIRRNGKKAVDMPLDQDYMAEILCWESKEDMIVIGTRSGDAYCITFDD
ncbi:quinon protein alcohol dehydrogenase-like superfamily [Mycena capillaripes]|nr:quinon protein alcohol dehydrogenase-like superfamily [Mycena capillaripes]